MQFYSDIIMCKRTLCFELLIRLNVNPFLVGKHHLSSNLFDNVSLAYR